MSTEATSAVSTEADEAAVATPWLVVAVREVMVKLRDRNFLISTLVTVAMIAGSVVFVSWFDSRTAEHTVAVVDDGGAQIVALAQDLAEGDEFTPLDVNDEDAARAALVAEEADVALLPPAEADGPWTVLGLTEVDGELEGLLGQATAAAVLEHNAQEAGTTAEELTAGSELAVELVEGDVQDRTLVQIVGFAFAFIFYMAAIMFGMTIATSVLEEKQNRVVEILATAVPVRHLLMGKVVGNSVLAFGQIALFAIVGLVALNFTDLVADIGFILGSAGWFVVFFVVGFFALAAVWGVLGSMASRTEDLNSNTTSVMMIIMVATFVGIFATGTVLTVASFVPLVSTVAMPIRMLDGDVALWQTLASLGLNLLGAYLLVRLAARIYQRAVLQSGTALGWRQAMRLEA